MKTKKRHVEYQKVVLDKDSNLDIILIGLFIEQLNRLHKKKKKKIAAKNRRRSLSFEGLFPKDGKTLEGGISLEGNKEEIDDMPPSTRK